MFVVFFAFIALSFASDPKPCLSCTDCAKCLSQQAIPGTFTKKVAISLSDCKGSDISWFCCRSSSGSLTSSSCEVSSCDGNMDRSKNKCDEASQVTYTVPYDATELTVQLHDGAFGGNVLCTSEGGTVDCCGGTGNGNCGFLPGQVEGSGVCQTTINLLDDCHDIPPPPECTTDNDCSGRSGVCAKGVCNDGKCSTTYFVGKQCRASAGLCDVAEVCVSGNSACPEDAKRPVGYACRNALGACDVTETCDGDSNDCPADSLVAAGVECRSKADQCDVSEFCTGNSPYCPEDVRKDWAYTYKCGTTQFLCGVTREELTLNSGGGYFLGTCGIGTSKDSFVQLEWPACSKQCINSLCPNDRGLSNVGEAHCIPSTGSWACDKKTDVVSGVTPDPYCPSFVK